VETVGILILVANYFQERGEARQRVKWVVAGFAVGYVLKENLNRKKIATAEAQAAQIVAGVSESTAEKGAIRCHQMALRAGDDETKDFDYGGAHFECSASLKPAPGKTSPIIETVQRIAVDRFSGRAAGAGAAAMSERYDLLDRMTQDPDAGVRRGVAISLAHMAPVMTAAFLASLVEAIEALTIVLAVGTTRSWRSSFYGVGAAEHRVGDALRDKNRDDWVLSTKVGRLLRPKTDNTPSGDERLAPMPFNVVYDYGYDGIMRSFEDSLQRLGLARVDILYVHDIGEYQHGEANAAHMKVLRESGRRALERLRSSGAVRAVGLGVNETKVLVDVLGWAD